MVELGRGCLSGPFGAEPTATPSLDMPVGVLSRVQAGAPDAAGAVVASLRQDGACVVEGMFAASTIATMRCSVLSKAEHDASTDAKPGSASQGYIPASETLTDDAPSWIAEFVGVNTVRFSSLGKIGGDETRDAYFEMLNNPLYRAVADEILLPFAGSYWVNTAQAMLIGPGSPAQPLHRCVQCLCVLQHLPSPYMRAADRCALRQRRGQLVPNV
jgi:hypothetical protein